MVIHFFELKMTHLSLELIDTFNFYFKDKAQQAFYIYHDEQDLLFGTKEEEEVKYRSCFEKNNITNYKFVYGEEAVVNVIKEEAIKRNLCVLHGYYPLRLIYKSFGLRLNLLSRIVFVHWGGVQEITKDKLINFRFKLGFIRRKLSYSLFKCIVVLAESDKEMWKKNYGIRNVIVSPYFPSPQNIDKRYKIIERQRKDKVKVMVAHSGHTYSNHVDILTRLKNRFDDVIEEVSCPLCYGPKDYIDEVIKVGQGLFGTRFNYFTELLPKEEYIDYIRSKDVYVTASPIQSGLFATAVALGNGLKVFCGQSNFDKYVSRGCIIYHFDDLLETTKEDFVLPLKEDDIINNYEKISDKETIQKVVDKWKEILFGKVKFDN